ncbi:MAG: U32 family peptidase [Ruminococcaceae bacterium]|nr:U32 family peptidase [Oscillospiraceae bacterium]
MANDYKNKLVLPELLAPAGNPDALEAAIEAGADAVYFGAGSFNARMRAKNFSSEDLTNALKLCAQYGVKSYITVNTRLRDGELAEVKNLAGELYDAGADALIIADMGVAKVIRDTYPDFELHASTQVSGHNAADGAVLRELGFSRMVCPREMSLEEISRLVKESPVEIEMFVHGAHCVSFSGQCMMSFAMGGRSGNRGMCAQPCRLHFKIEGVKNQYPLSLKDMSLAGSIPEIIESGVSSLKIEGRQKSARYVHGVISVYRQLLDEGRRATPDEIRKLEELFSRDGFTDGYLKKSYRSMLGVRKESDVLSDRENTEKISLTKRIPLEAKLTLKVGAPAVLTVTDGKRCAEVTGDEVLSEPERPLSKEAAEKNMSRLGGTAFVLDKFEFDAEKEGFVTLSCINRMRREAIDALCEKKREGLPVQNEEKNEYSAPVPKKDRRKLYTAEFLRLSDVTEKAKEFFDIIYLPLDEAEKTTEKVFAPALYPLTFDGEKEELKKRLEAYATNRGEKCEILVNGLGQAHLAKECGLVPIGSFRFNVTNKEAAKVILRYTENVCISPEAPMGLLKDTGEKSSAVIYGRIPLMHTQRCMLSNGGASCAFGGAGGRVYPAKNKKMRDGAVNCDGKFCLGALSDRKNASFPMVGLPDCTNIIYNSVPIYMGDKMGEIEKLPTGRFHFIFTVESPAECDRALEGYEKRLAPRDPAKIKRLK